MFEFLHICSTACSVHLDVDWFLLTLNLSLFTSLFRLCLPEFNKRLRTRQI
ncbi:unnamed protein product [Schistosoma curassoni]|nr:unnamed protein product [Schistosoma curassoni]